jgi:hypothetical protein
MVKKAKRISESDIRIVDFDFGDRTYQIDTTRQRVYRSFVEIETSKAVEIFSSWRSQNAQA